jgi:hypothetical protein
MPHLLSSTTHYESPPEDRRHIEMLTLVLEAQSGVPKGSGANLCDRLNHSQ